MDLGAHGTDDKGGMALSFKQQAFITEYLRDFNATQAAIRAGYSERTAQEQGSRLLSNVMVAGEIKRRVSEKAMTADEVMLRLSEQARADLGIFFKLVEEWTYYPLPSYDVVDAKEVDILDEDGNPTGEKKISYWVRHVVVDLEKVMDPRYSHLLHKFSDSPKNGVGVEIYNKQTALQTLAKIHGLAVDKAEVSATIDVGPALDRALKRIYGDNGGTGT